MIKIGIELGIRAPLDAINRAVQIADSNSLEYFLVPETHPKVFGVDALDSLLKMSEKVNHVKLGTGIINVFSTTSSTVSLPKSGSVTSRSNSAAAIAWSLSCVAARTSWK